MYSPQIFSSGLYELWRRDNKGQGSINQVRNHIGEGTGALNGSPNNDNHDDEQEGEEQNIIMRNLFAPPLLAFSAEFPGASTLQLEYTISQSQVRSGMPLVTPLTQKRMEAFQKIRSIGYRRFAPLGINKTMEQIDIESSKQHTSAEIEVYEAGAENTSGERVTNRNEERSGNWGAQSAINESYEANEVDLDAEIPDADESEQSDMNYDEEDSRIHFRSLDMDDDILNEDEGFMADEVEYQDDHSVETSPSLPMLHSAATTTRTIFTNMDSARSYSTNPTTINTAVLGGGQVYSSLHPHNGDQNDLSVSFRENDSSELDMVVERNS